MRTNDRPPRDVEPTIRTGPDATVERNPWSIVVPHARRGVAGKGNAAARRYAGVIPSRNIQHAPATHEPIKPDAKRNARIEADMALAMGILPTPGQARTAQAQQVQAKRAPAVPQPVTSASGARAGQAAPTSSAPAMAPGQAVGFNAHMTVSCWRGNRLLATWSGPARWSGQLPVKFRAQVRQARLTWQGGAPDEKSLRVGTDAAGKGGKSLRQWMHPRATLIVVNVVHAAQATGSGASGGPGDEDARDKPSAAAHDGKLMAHESLGAAGAKHEPIDIASLDLDSPLGGLTHAPFADSRVRTGVDQSASGSGRSERADQDATSLGEASEPTGFEGSGRDKGMLDGGGEHAKAGGVTLEQGGVDGEFSRIAGEEFGAEHGAIGGEGERDEFGVRGGGAVLGGMVNVPASLRPLTEVLLILEDANPGKLAGAWMRKGLERFSAATIRRQLRQEATAYAEMRIVKHLPRLRQALRKLPEDEAARYIRSLQWDIERRYFDKVAEGASNKIASVRGKLRRAKSRRIRREVKRELRQAEKLLEAAKVKPVAGKLPRNHQYAGKGVPRSKLPRGYKTKGLRFTADGYPDFAPYAVKLPNGARSVKIELTGSRKLDQMMANKAAGFEPPKTPKGYIWHHHQDGTTMELVPRDLHGSIPHTGGGAHYTHRTGIIEAYPD